MARRLRPRLESERLRHRFAIWLLGPYVAVTCPECEGVGCDGLCDWDGYYIARVAF